MFVTEPYLKAFNPALGVKVLFSRSFYQFPCTSHKQGLIPADCDLSNPQRMIMVKPGTEPSNAMNALREPAFQTPKVFSGA